MLAPKNLSLLVVLCLLLPAGEVAHAQTKGQATGLQLPRFVSLKSKRVNLRVGPGRDYAVQWLYIKPGLPVEVIQEYDRWRRVRDAQGTEGWVYHTLLSGKRTAIVAPWEDAEGRKNPTKFVTMHTAASSSAGITAHLQPGLIVDIDSCSAGWCKVIADDHDGHVQKKRLWGVYEKEEIGG